MLVDSIWQKIFELLPKPPTAKKVTPTTPTIRQPTINEEQIIFVPPTPINTVKVGTLITGAQLKLMSPTCDYNYIAPALDTAARQYGIVTPRQIRHWMAHLSVESGYFLHFEENLSYSAQRLVQVWPKRFPSLHDAEAYARQPRLLANKIYGGRLGNDLPNDGYNYRGRGFIQLTGKANYREAGTGIGVNLVDHPDLAANLTDAARIAGWYWKKNNMNAIVAKDPDEIAVVSVRDMYANEDDDLVQGTKAINGGLIGLTERRMELHKAMFIWKD